MTIANNYVKPSLILAFGLATICGFIVTHRARTDRHEQATNLTAGLVPSTNHPSTQTRTMEAFGQLPLSFEANHGQTDGQVKFLARGSGYGLFLTASEAVLQLRKPDDGKPSETKRHATKPQSAVVRMKLRGANPAPQVEGLDELPGKSNYFIGIDPSQWRSNIAHYAKVQYREVYPGIDLVYYGNQQQLEYDFIVAPGADPDVIKLSFAGVNGLRVDGQGDLVLRTGSGDVRQHKPAVWQEVDGVKLEVAGRYVINKKREIGFDVADYDTSRPLIIDPVLRYSTYLGGSNSDLGTDIAVDAAGNIYITGGAQSGNFPTTTGSYQPNFVGATCRSFIGFTFPCRDVFVTKLNAAGTALVYSTYLGGNDQDNSTGIVVDASGKVYVSGYTKSTNFPTTSGAYQTVFRGGGSEFSDYGDAFVTALNAAGSALVFSTYLGGGSDDGTGGIAVDATGNVYVAGFTDSANFPTTPGALKTIPEGLRDGFVTKLNPEGKALLYSTFLGGSGGDGASGLAVDAAGQAYVTGVTSSTNFPTINPVQAALNGDNDAFVAKLNPVGTALVYSTYLGGSGKSSESGEDIALDAAGNAYVTGYTGATDFPIANPLQATNKGGFDAFVAKLNAEGSTLAYSTYLGGSANEFGYDIAVDAAGNAHVAGNTESSDFPTASPLQAAYGGKTDAFVAKINFAGSAFVYSTYLGGSVEDYGYGIALDTAGNAYVTGFTLSSNFPTANPLRSYGGSGDAFISKIVDDPPPPNDVGITAIGGANVVAIGSSVMISVTLTNLGTATQGTFPVSYRINDGPEVTEMFTENISPGASANKPFAVPWMPPSLGNFTIVARTKLTGDQRPANDSFSKAVRVTVANDLGVSGFVELPVRVGIGGSATIKVRVTNFGASPQSNFSISFQINDGPPVTESFSGTLAPLQTAIKTFAAPFTPPEPGTYRITARTNLAGDENAANDAAQTTLPAIRAQYRGSWQGTTGQSLPIRFTVDERDIVTSVEMDYRVSNFALGTCVYRIGGSGGIINNSQFELSLGGGLLGFITGSEPKLRGTFSSPTACTGTVSASSVGFAICGNNTVISTGFSVSGSTFSAQRQVLCPTVSSVSPASGTVGAIVTITGANLNDVTAVKFANNVTANFTIVSDTQITARVPAGSGNGPITLSKAGCTDVQTGAFSVQSAAEPMLANLNPPSAIAGGGAFTLTVTGANFIAGSIVRWNGSDRPTTFVSSTQLTAAIPASDIVQAGTANISVFTPPPGGGTTSARQFLITSRVSSVSAASFTGAELAAESIVAAFGVNLATRIETAPGGQPLPTELAGTKVEVRDSAGMLRLAPLFFVAPQQINYLMPPMTAAGAATITITSGDGKVAIGTMQIAAVAPSLFAANANGQGVAAAVILRRKADGTDSFEPVARFDPAQNRFVAVPIDLGPEGDQVFLILYGTGIRNRSALSAVTVAIGGLNSEVLFAGATPGLAGLDQSNVRLSRSLAGRGDANVVLMSDGKPANTIIINVK